MALCSRRRSTINALSDRVAAAHAEVTSGKLSGFDRLISDEPASIFKK
jgi:hypothetical protein